MINTNDILTVHFIGDTQLKPTIKILHRSNKTVTFKHDGEIVKRKVHNRDGQEFIYPFGQYSFSPIAYK